MRCQQFRIPTRNGERDVTAAAGHLSGHVVTMKGVDMDVFCQSGSKRRG